MTSEVPPSSSPPPPPPNQVTNGCDVVGTHVSRAFMCQIVLAKPTVKETTMIQKGDGRASSSSLLMMHSILQSYLVWRRSTMLVSLPFIFVGMILGIIDCINILSDDATKEVYNGFGKILITIQSLDSIFLFAGVVAAFVYWNQCTRSIQMVRLGFLISFIMPLIPALFPLEMLVKDEIYNAVADSDILGIKVVLSMGYVLQLLPIIISFPGGAIRGGLRIRWLLPESMLSGWILVLTAPFYSILLCVALIVVMQVAGNFLLFIGTLFVVAAPWVYVVKSSYFVRLWNDDTKKNAALTQRVAGITSLIGFAIIIIYAFTGDVSGVRFIGTPKSDFDTTTYLISYAEGFRIVIETFARLFVTTLMFCDAFLRMNIHSWFDHEDGKISDADDEIRTRFQAFADILSNSTNTKQSESPTEVPPNVDVESTTAPDP